ncbi:anaerobic ribonucleoside-triphosphate reductase activating protein [Paenibacillus glacialis]|uniref:Anaerobic ribonucleoside-triphosphate reductase-activating protein n=1 Tax=Paenibacillus glacialis TaxID=494026 RepID=A0A168N4U7_9BACL|nr:anaerobic ribonucleoside-triphosphate reductase activating protein [Paenibacillus glacialis]OAB45389.1 anaerobic ribonucleoside-triphosphate reductase activating protein [Paenibacillus glacialis]
MNICGYYPESINEGDGLRAVIFLSGCRHRCSGCFNPETWNFNYGEPFTEHRQQEIINEMANNPLLDGMTLAGGDPFFSADEAADFIDKVRISLPNFSVWIYTGYMYEDIMAHMDSAEYRLLQKCQVVIDGPFIESLKNTSLPYRGSSNQRIIDIQANLRHDVATLL